MAVCRIHSREALDALKSATGVFRRTPHFRVQILAPVACKPRRLKTLERRLAFALSDCGCAFASLALLLTPALMLFVGDYSLTPVWPKTAWLVLAAVASALFAKIISLCISYHVAHRSIDELREFILPANDGGLPSGETSVEGERA